MEPYFCTEYDGVCCQQDSKMIHLPFQKVRTIYPNLHYTSYLKKKISMLENGLFLHLVKPFTNFQFPLRKAA